MTDRLIDETQLQALVGHRFAGGSYRIEHWENWLLTDCTGRSPMPDDVVHPVALFHVPILGVGTSISELFRLGQARGAGSVGLQGYDWQYFATLRENVDYQMAGGIIEAQRTTSDEGAVVDRLAFEIDLYDGDLLTARVTNRWIFRRST